MALACPVDAYKPLDFISHVLTPSWSQPDHRDHRQSLYWRPKRNLPPDVRRGHPAGGAGPLQMVKPQGWFGYSRQAARSGQSASRPVHDRFKGTGLG